jgi:DNA-binding IclR family transcriptional regulator
MKQATNPIKSVETTTQILECIEKHNGATISEIADQLDTTRATVHNHLSTLKQADLIVKEGCEYQLGLRFFTYGEQVKRQQTILDVGASEVDKLAEETGELGNLLVEEHGRGIYLHRAKGEDALSLDTGVGSRVYLHQTALGKAILAHLPREYVNEIVEQCGLDQSTENTVGGRAELFERLEEVRDRGYALDLEERVPEIHCVAAPIITNDDRVQGAVSVAGPASRLTGDRLHETIPELVTQTANVIGINLSYSEPI